MKARNLALFFADAASVAMAQDLMRNFEMPATAP